MNQEQEISDQVQKYQELAKANPSIDLAALAMHEFKHSGNFVSAKVKRWSYIISLLFPPVGIFIAIYFFLEDKRDGKTVAWVCIALTGLAILLTWMFLAMMLSSSGTSIEQLQEINPDDLRQLLE